MNESHWDLLSLLWSSFGRILGPSVTVISIPLAFLFWYFFPGQTVRLAVVIPILIILVIIIMTLSDATIRAAEKNRIKLPKILNSQVDQISGYINCLLEPSELFSEDIAVSFYYAPPGSFEVLIGVGHVGLIRTLDKKIQVRLIRPVDAYVDIIRSLANNNENIRKNVYIKPTVQKVYLGKGG